MQEDFIHFLWKFKKFDVLNVKTIDSKVLHILDVGQHNFNSGPDFFNAKIKIGEQLWAGNVELHLKSSDWYTHHHETDKAYDNVILHVVWDHDAEIFRKDKSIVPTLELKNFVPNQLLKNYHQLFSSKKQWIPCENNFAEVDDFIFNHWKERLYIERLERKSQQIDTLLHQTRQHWEEVLFRMLFRNFGLKVNADAFESVAKSIDFSIVRKLQSNPIELEALFLGQAGLLDQAIEDGYFGQLQQTYKYLSQKFSLHNTAVAPVQFFRLRPSNFPTIRLVQLAQLYSKHYNLFSNVMAFNNLNDFYKLFEVGVSEFWKTHYTFQSVSKSSEKRLTKSFIDLLLINTIIPIKYCYKHQKGNFETEEIFDLANSIKAEDNTIIKKFNSLKPIVKSAMDSQALLQLKNNYCDAKKCLHCAIGNALITN
jgi:hypothetical protein